MLFRDDRWFLKPTDNQLAVDKRGYDVVNSPLSFNNHSNFMKAKIFLSVLLIVFSFLYGHAQTTPTGLTVQAASATSIQLSWDTVSNAISYKLYTCDDIYVTNTNVNQYLKVGLLPDSEYTFKVNAVFENGEESEYSSCVSQTTLAVPDSQPTSFTKGLQRLRNIQD